MVFLTEKSFFSAFSKIPTKRTFVLLLFLKLNQSRNTKEKNWGGFLHFGKATLHVCYLRVQVGPRRTRCSSPIVQCRRSTTGLKVRIANHQEDGHNKEENVSKDRHLSCWQKRSCLRKVEVIMFQYNGSDHVSVWRKRSCFRRMESVMFQLGRSYCIMFQKGGSTHVLEGLNWNWNRSYSRRLEQSCFSMAEAIMFHRRVEALIFQKAGSDHVSENWIDIVSEGWK